MKLEKTCIGIDASRYGHNAPTGVEVYSNYVIDGLIKRAEKHKEHLLLIAPTQKLKKSTNFIHQEVVLGRRLWTLKALTKWMKKRSEMLSVLFVPSHILPLTLPKRSVVTIHDLASKRLPRVYSLKERLIMDLSTRFAIRKASKIIAISEATKKDLIHFFKCPTEKIEVIHHGFDKEAFLKSFKEKKGVLEKYGVEKGKYFCFIGRVEDKKNIPLIISAFVQADIPKDFKLLLIGKDGIGHHKVDILLETSLEERIIKTGYLPNDEAYTLLKHAAAFTFPSKFEGFGIPILEAYALGVPVITSRNGAIPEVAGKGARFVRTKNPRELKLAMQEVAGNPNFVKPFKKEMEKQLLEFSWEKCVDQTWDVLMSSS